MGVDLKFTQLQVGTAIPVSVVPIVALTDAGIGNAFEVVGTNAATTTAAIIPTTVIRAEGLALTLSTKARVLGAGAFAAGTVAAV